MAFQMHMEMGWGCDGDGEGDGDGVGIEMEMEFGMGMEMGMGLAMVMVMVLQAMTVIAGASHMDLTRFVPSLCCGRWLRYTLLGYMGREYGEECLHVLKTHKSYVIILVIVLLVMALLFFALKHYLFRPRTRLTRSASIDELPEALQVLI